MCKETKKPRSKDFREKVHLNITYLDMQKENNETENNILTVRIWIDTRSLP